MNLLGEEACDRSPDGVHCLHRWEAEDEDGPCCWCDDRACDLEHVTDEDRIAQFGEVEP